MGPWLSTQMPMSWLSRPLTYRVFTCAVIIILGEVLHPVRICVNVEIQLTGRGTDTTAVRHSPALTVDLHAPSQFTVRFLLPNIQ